MDNNIEKYKQFRSFGTKFVNIKLIEFINKYYTREIVLSSAKVLGMIEGKKTITLDNKDDTQYLFDFALHESKIEGENAIQLYKEKIGVQGEMEEKFTTALQNSYTSIFRVINTSPDKGLIFLKDILGTGKNIRLTDPGLSQMANMDLVIFTRILTFEDMNITSGMNCSFLASKEKYIMLKYEQHKKINPNYSKSDDRFLFFYNVFKEMGAKTEHQEV